MNLNGKPPPCKRCIILALGLFLGALILAITSWTGWHFKHVDAQIQYNGSTITIPQNHTLTYDLTDDLTGATEYECTPAETVLQIDGCKIRITGTQDGSATVLVTAGREVAGAVVNWRTTPSHTNTYTPMEESGIRAAYETLRDDHRRDLALSIAVVGGIAGTMLVLIFFKKTALNLIRRMIHMGVGK